MVNRKFYFLIPFVLFFYIYNTSGSDVNEPSPAIVQISSGPIRGSLMKSRDGRWFNAFRGIPYAKPPIGELRFKAPESPEPWTSVYNATKDADSCLQKNYLFHQNPSIEGSEDCLYLNVYSPLDATPENKLPVLVFIHYGAFIAGSSKSTLLGPEFLMDGEPIVIVTFNYRLSIFGFFSSLDDAAPGNWAMKDQVLLLRWVQKDIENFGGDPKQVTIQGPSAGAGSVHHHVLSPSSSGLFHRAIMQSGSALALWAKPANALHAMVFRGIAAVVGCNATATTAEIVNCVRQVDGNTLVAAQDAFKFFAIEPLNVYTFVTETETELNPEPFLKADPAEIIRSGEFNKVPMMIGVTQDEGILRTGALVRQAENLKTLNSKFDELLPRMMLLEASVPPLEVPNVWNKMKSFFMGGKNIDVNDPNSIEGFTQIYTDRAFKYGSYQSALYHSFVGHRPIWFYNFDYRGLSSYGDVFAATNETVPFNWGVSHCDDLLYLFNAPDLPFPQLSGSDLSMSKFMVKMFKNFISGKPPYEAWDPLPNVNGHSPMDNSYLCYLNITGKYRNVPNMKDVALLLQNNFHTERMRFWESLPLFENIKGIE